MIRAAAKESVAFQRKKWDEQEAKSLAVVTKPAAPRSSRRRQGVVPGRDGAGVRQVHDHARPAAPGQGGPGHQVSHGKPRPPRARPAACVRRGRSKAPHEPLAPTLAPEVVERPTARPNGRGRHPYTRLCALLSKASLMLAVVGLIAIIALRAVPGDRPLRLQRHADLGRGAGAAAGAVRHRARRGGRRARRRPHRAGIAGRRCCPSAWRLRIEMLIHVLVGAVRRAHGRTSGWHVDDA